MCNGIAICFFICFEIDLPLFWYHSQFAMGLNMPAKTVVFTAVKKWDGDSHRYIGSGEYIQVSQIIFFLPRNYLLCALVLILHKYFTDCDYGFCSR